MLKIYLKFINGKKYLRYKYLPLCFLEEIKTELKGGIK